NKVPNGPSSEELARLFEAIFRRYPKASAIGFATIPSTDEGGLSLSAVNRMIAGAIRGLKSREKGRFPSRPLRKALCRPSGEKAGYVIPDFGWTNSRKPSHPP